MCGFAGVADFSGRGVEPALVARMRRCLHHRGPDDQRELCDDDEDAPGFSAGLGFCRLAIIDLSPLGAQPMRSGDGRVSVVFNGEIYNHHELRRDLEAEGASLRSRSDTEVLAELLARRWERAVTSLRGMFAFVAVDRRARRVLLARDRVGKKPLYYRFADGRLWFGSELKALLADEAVPREIDPEALSFYLRYQYVPSPRTIFKGISKLEPAHVMSCTAAGCTSERYWSLEFAPKLHVSFAEAVPEVRRLVEESVRIRLESDVPLGTFLSGGVDSSIVTRVTAGLVSQPVKTFSIGFDESAFDERPYARQLASRFGTEHHEFVVRPEAVDTLPRLAVAYDEPFGDSSALPTYHVSRLTRQHVTVALSGDGGDEAFGGYERYAANVLASSLSPIGRIPGVRRLADRVLLEGRVPPSRSLRRAAMRLWEGLRVTDPARRYAGWMTGIPAATVDALFPAGRSHARAVDEYLVAQYRQGASSLSGFDRMQRLDVLTYLPEDLLVKVDRASMANSLEVRAPLLDHVLLEFVASLPGRVRNPRLRLKLLLKAAFPEIPPKILHRRKAGFGVPVADWFRADLGSCFADSVLTPGSRSSGWLDPAVTRLLFETHRRGERDHSTALWTVLMFELWHRTHLG